MNGNQIPNLKGKDVEISTRNHTQSKELIEDNIPQNPNELSKKTSHIMQDLTRAINYAKNSNFEELKKQNTEDASIRHGSCNLSKDMLIEEVCKKHLEISTRNHTQRKKQSIEGGSLRHSSSTFTKQTIVKEAKNTVKSKENKEEKRQRKLKKLGSKSRNTKGHLIVYYTNADSVSNKMNILIEEVERIKPHIIGITEVKPKHCKYALQTSEVNIPGYTLYENLTKNGRGICLYVDQKLNVGEANIDTYDSEECVWIEVRGKENETLTVGCIYRSPNTSEENCTNINKMIQNLNSTKKILVMGDFNYPEIIWKDPDNIHATDAKAEVFLESTRDAFLFQHVTEPTRHRANQKRNLLDLVFTTDDSVDNVRLEAPIGKSDHCSIAFEVQMNYDIKNEHQKSYPNYNKADYNAMKTDVTNIDWKNQLANKDVNEAWNLLNQTLKESCKRNVPIITKREGKKCPLWMNQSALAKVKKKHHAWKRYLETTSGEDYLQYTKARNQAKWETRKAQKLYEKKIAKESKKNPKKFWGYVNSKRKSKTNIPDLDKTNGKKSHRTTNDTEKAELFNQYFKEVFTKEDLVNVPDVERKIIDKMLEEVEITEEKVEKKLKKLNQNKSPGPDNVHPRILKELSAELAKPLSIIFKKSLDAGKLPISWKDGHIIPIFKKGNKHKVENYRPVCLTVICCKILESILRDSIMDYLTENSLITPEQHGFLIGRSTFTQLIETLEKWTSMLDHNDNIDILYCDFKKAFDTVPHHRLMLKVRSLGIGGKIEKWIQDFLTERRQRVCINGKKSNWVDVSSGVPQGSVLGPLLFVIFINDLPEAIDCLSKMYADDTKIYQAVNNSSDAKFFQENIKLLWKWSIDWQLHFHPDKCHILHLGKTNEKHRYYMGAGDDTPHTHLKATTEEKDLGVIIDDQLTFSNHCDKIVTTANKLLGIMRRTFTYLDKNVFSLVYKGIIRPIIEYASSVYSPILMRDINKIESIQRRATKMVVGLSNKSYEQRLKALDLPALRFRRARGDMINVYKYLHQDYKVDTTDLLPLNPDSRTRGHYLKIQGHQCNTRSRLHFFSQRIVNKWNNLKTETISAPTVDSFKNRLDKEWNKNEAKFNYTHCWFEPWRH